MNKTQYRNEIVIKEVMKKGKKTAQNKNVQEWLRLYKLTHPEFAHEVGIDGDFGERTEAAVKDFQKANGLGVDGVVGQNTYRKLVEPMTKAFTKIEGISIRDLIIAYAKQHLNSAPYEMGGANRGPWVRAYMDGMEGKDWLWCMGFVQTILDQAFFTLGQDFTTVMKRSFSCDEIANKGQSNGRFLANADAQKTPEVIQPGDVFLRRNPKNNLDWTHTGIIVQMVGTIMHTIEGNTNEQGASEGVKVGALEKRNLKEGNYDIYRVLM
jgi:hypothetical protein